MEFYEEVRGVSINQLNEQLFHCLITVGTVPQTRRAPLLGRKPNWANDKA